MIKDSWLWPFADIDESDLCQCHRLLIRNHETDISSTSTSNSTRRSWLEREFEFSVLVINPVSRFLAVGVNVGEPPNATSCHGLKVGTMLVEQCEVILRWVSILLHVTMAKRLHVHFRRLQQLHDCSAGLLAT